SGGLEQKPSAALASYTLAEVPLLSSRPGSSHTIFMDFNGAPAFDWHGNSGTQRAHGAGGTNNPIPAFTFDANANAYDDSELTAIHVMWEQTAELYSPFDVNVTTIDPGVYADNATVRVVIGGSNSDWYGSGGGVAAIGGFASSSLDNTCFMFAQDAVNLTG